MMTDEEHKAATKKAIRLKQGEIMIERSFGVSTDGLEATLKWLCTMYELEAWKGEEEDV